MRLDLHAADYAIIFLYFLFVIAVGWLVKRKIKSSNDYLMSGRSIPLWITSLAFVSAKLGAQEVIGMSAAARTICCGAGCVYLTLDAADIPAAPDAFPHHPPVVGGGVGEPVATPTGAAPNDDAPVGPAIRVQRPVCPYQTSR